MAHVVGEPCVQCKHGHCVEVCPVNCFYEGDDQLYIKPDECIDCDACVPECPVNAITTDTDAKPEYVEKNKNFPYSDDKRRSTRGDVTHGPKAKT